MAGGGAAEGRGHQRGGQDAQRTTGGRTPRSEVDAGGVEGTVDLAVGVVVGHEPVGGRGQAAVDAGDPIGTGCGVDLDLGRRNGHQQADDGEGHEDGPDPHQEGGRAAQQPGGRATHGPEDGLLGHVEHRGRSAEGRRGGGGRTVEGRAGGGHGAVGRHRDHDRPFELGAGHETELVPAGQAGGDVDIEVAQVVDIAGGEVLPADGGHGLVERGTVGVGALDGDGVEAGAVRLEPGIDGRLLGGRADGVVTVGQDHDVGPVGVELDGEIGRQHQGIPQGGLAPGPQGGQGGQGCLPLEVGLGVDGGLGPEAHHPHPGVGRELLDEAGRGLAGGLQGRPLHAARGVEHHDHIDHRGDGIDLDPSQGAVLGQPEVRGHRFQLADGGGDGHLQGDGTVGPLGHVEDLDLVVAALGRRRGGHGQEDEQDQRGQGSQPDHADNPRPLRGSRARSRPSGSSMPMWLSSSENMGRRPVGWSSPAKRPSSSKPAS